MMITLRLGWRNLWRNSRRSLISISAMACAFTFLILLLGLAAGLRTQLLENGTRLMLGHVQLQHPEYLPDRGLYDTLGGDRGVERERLLQSLEAVPAVRAITERVYGFALLSTGEHSAGSQLVGVTPDAERRVTSFLDALVEGGPDLAPESHSLWLGRGLARELDARLGSEVAAVTQAADGSLGNELFTVTGILRTGLSPLDRSLAVVHLADLQKLLALDGSRLHEVVMRLDSPTGADRLVSELSGRLPDGVAATSWGDRAPQLRDYIKLSESSSWILIAFVGLFAALGIWNTMMMSVFERTREIGVVGSLGMLPSQIVVSILAESVFLALVGLALGLAIGILLMQYFTVHGLDLSRWTGEVALMNTYIDPVLRFEWGWAEVRSSALGLLVSALAAAIIPAAHAARLKPVDALSAPTEG